MLALLLALALPAAAERAPYSPRRLAMARQVTAVQSSPDGRTAYYVTDITGALELWSVSADGGAPQQLTDLGERVLEPALSPDGRLLAFAADKGGDERPDLFLIPAEGGDPVPLAVSTRAESSPAFSPDGSSLAFLADPDAPFHFELFTLDLRSGRERRLTRERRSLHAPLWSPDGRALAAASSSDGRSGSLLLVAADGSSRRELAPPTRGGLMLPAAWSPDGRQLLTLAEDDEGFRRLYVLDPRSGKGLFVGPKGWDVERAAWKEDGLLFTRNEGGASALYRLKFGGKATPLLPPAGRIEDCALDASGAKLLYVWSHGTRAPDVWRLDLRTGLNSQLTHSMPPGVRPDELALADMLEYKSFDGRRIRALHLAPRLARLGSPPPLVVIAHGGPDAQAGDEFSPLRQALVEAGFSVLVPNFRGSSGYGRRFLEANRKDWGGGDRRDLLAGVRHLAEQGQIDPRRVGLMGSSYGGYLTLYALARDEEGAWAAGVASSAMPDLALDYELSKPRFEQWYKARMGSPETDAELFRERSPVTHLEGLKAPLLLFHGAKDANVPQAGARAVYERLKAMGREPRLFVYHDEGHGFTRRRNLADHYEKVVAFFAETLRPRGGRSAEPPAAALP